MAPLITFTSDFGHGVYVAQVKGVMLGICGSARVIDVTHDVAPGDVREAAYLLEVTLPKFSSAVHLAVVDPGVGTERRGIVVAAGGSILVGPDNGLFTAFLDEADEVREIANKKLYASEVSPTFHGRDVFGPVAARLAAGFALSEVGPPLEGRPVMVSDLYPDGDTGVVLHVDRFGNLVTNFPGEDLPAMVRGPGSEICTVAETYGEVTGGGPFLYAGSGGRLEIAVRDGSAASALGWARGTALSLEAIP